MEVEVILAQVREDENAEADPEQALERRAVRRRFHRAASVAGVEHLADRRWTSIASRCGAHRRAPLAADPVLDRAEKAGPAAGRGEDGEEEEGGGRLPVRAGHPGDLSSRVGWPKKASAASAIASRESRDDELGNGQIELALDDERGRAVGDGLGREIVPVGLEAGHADEERAGCDAAGIVGEVGDLDAGGIDGARRARTAWARSSRSMARDSSKERLSSRRLAAEKRPLLHGYSRISAHHTRAFQR